MWGLSAIPEMTDPLGKFWKQPSRGEIEIDDTHALMSSSAFKRLPEYSSSIPSGVYPGKMWRAQSDGGWWLRWFGTVDGRPDLCSNNQRQILVADGNGGVA